MKRFNRPGGARRLAAVLGTALLALTTLTLVSSSTGEAASKRTTTPPTNLSPPVISGTAQIGQTLSTSNGTWQSSPAITFYTYHWGLCDANGNLCGNIPGATGQTYTIVAADAGHTIRIYVTANNADGYTTQRSTETKVIPGGTPTNTAIPTISGVAAVGQILTASTGSWQANGSLSFTFLWGRCDSSGSGCSNIAHTDSPTYIPVSADIGHTLLVYVTANSAGGSATVHSAPTTAVVQSAGAPQNTAAPTISGNAQIGATLTANVGKWTSSLPITFYTYTWARCNASAQNCVNIGGAGNAKYTLTSADVGSRLLVYVTANSQVGFTTAHSAATGVVQAAAPVGAIQIGNGVVSIPASTVALPDRLVIDKVAFSPNPVR